MNGPNLRELRDLIRARRRVIPDGEGRYQVLSTAGDYHHEIRWLPVDKAWVCDTCLTRHGSRMCWARRRVIDHLENLAQAGAHQ